MGPKVPVVTTSTFWAAFLTPSSATKSIISSAVKTTASPFLIFSFISGMVLDMKQVSCGNALSNTNKNSLFHSIFEEQKQGTKYHNYLIKLFIKN